MDPDSDCFLGPDPNHLLLRLSTHNEVSTDALYAKGDLGGDSGPKHMASEMVWACFTSNFVYQLGQEYSKTCLKRPLKKVSKNWFSRLMSLNAGQKYWRKLQESILQYF